ncbi:AHH domain-containing protein [Snodgrassella sp. ESL0323]|uniref:AHH domain-containing protein n=1 Tax=Snodgrassella sp. ESL0323 TaxID=2705034 RepID=UPI001932F22F|nr:AHH domain-containing protein [Snodgrassella sp. ESL0323]
MWGGYNLYQYAPNPLIWIDPWGLKNWTYNNMPGFPGYQKHHIIPQQLRNHELIKRAGANIHASNNIIYLSTLEDVHPTRTIHKGSHRVYTDALESKMNALVEIGEKNNWTQADYKAALDKLRRQQRADLRNCKVFLNKNSIRSKGC